MMYVVDEGVQGREVDPGEGPADGEALALEARGRGRHRVDGAAHGPRNGLGDPGQGEDVLDGHGRHGAHAPWVVGLEAAAVSNTS
ncbi:hypothetical protein GCM10012283_25150 [Phycicoccus endophyticus]|nr:hypothetical protein GCM10012283_25150 [Phycicoccus endophyticus]